MLEIVADLQSALLSPSLKRRDNALERVRHIVFPDQSHEAISKDDQNVTLAMIADCYFSSYYHEKKWFWDLQECILQSCCNNDYLKEIHKFFHNKVHVNTNHSGQQLMRLYNLYIKIIQTQCENNSFDSLDTVEFLGTIIDLSINCSKTYTTRISSSFKSACFKSRNFLEVCWLNWTSDSSKYPFGALGIVLITEGSGSLRELYLVRSAFVKTVILAKPGTVVLSNCLSLYLSTLKQTDWEENVEDGSGSMESGIMKMLKKAPEGFSSTAAFLLSSICQIDVSGMVMEGAINLAVRMIKSIDILVRQSGEDFTVNLIAKSGRSEARARIFSVLLECLLGKGQSAVVELSQKMSVCLLIDRCIHHCDSTFFIDIIEMIFNLVEKENDENIRTLSFYWIGILSGRASNISQRCLPWLRDKIVNSKGKLLSLPLIAVLAMVEKNPEAIAHIASITDELIGIVVDANLKPSLVSSEGVIACKLVFDLWKYDNELQEKCKSSKFSSVVLDPNSFLYHENLSKYIGSGTNKLSKRENFGMDLMRKYVVKSLGCIFSDSINFLSSRFTSILLQSTCSKPLQVLLNCCIHPDVTVRSCFTNYAEFVISSLDAIRVMLLDSLWDKLVGIDQECHFLNRSDTSKIELDEGKVSSNLHDYRNMVQICCSYQKNLTIENLIRLLPSSLSVICHPLVSPSRKGSLKLWIKVTQSFDTVLESLTDEQMMLVAKSISDSLFANAISSLRATRQCSYHALYVLLNSKRSAFSSQKLYAILYENLASVIGTILKDGRFWSLSTSDHKLYNNFQEEISLAISNIETTTNVSKVSNSDRRKEVTKHSRKANFGGDSTFEEDWAERLRLEKIRKTVSEQLTDSMNSIRNRLKIRFDEIEKIILETRYTIDLLKRFIDGQREMSKMFLPEILLESVLPYFKYESMRATCQACLHDICSSLIEPDFSQLLRYIHHKIHSITVPFLYRHLLILY